MTQSDKWHETRKERMDALFLGKRYEIVEEFKNEYSVETPLGYKVKSGYRLRLVEGSSDDEIVVGRALLNQLAQDYNAVERPPARKRGRPRKQPLEQAEVWAGRDMPDDAQQVTQPGPTYTNYNADEEV